MSLHRNIPRDRGTHRVVSRTPVSVEGKVKALNPSVQNWGISGDVALVHDWLPTIGGAEAVLREMIGICEQSTVYTLFDFLNDLQRGELTRGRCRIVTSGLNRLPGVSRYYRALLLRCTRAIEEFDVSGHEIVLSSSAALAKGVLSGPDQTHIAYVHSPARYAWDLSHAYLAGLGTGPVAGFKRALARRMLHEFRHWDTRTAQHVDHFIANSEFVRRRIRKAYRREATVIHPPVDVARLTPGDGPRDEAYLSVSRLVPYKQTALIVAAFAARPRLKLRVAGDGSELAALRKSAPPNVEILGRRSAEEVKRLMQRARALVFAACEDFGIVPVEAQACGTPVIAYGRGGALETVRGGEHSHPTGLFFDAQTVPSLVAALDAFEADGAQIRAKDCRANALRFDAARFRRDLSAFVATHRA